MNRIKIYSLLVCMAMWTACEVEEPIGVQPDNLTTASAPEVTQVTQSFYDLSDPDNTAINFSLKLSGNDPVEKVEVYQTYKGGETKLVETITSFPTDVSISLADAMAQAGVTVDNLNPGDVFLYTFKVFNQSGSSYFTNTKFSASTTCVVQAPFEGTYEITDDCGLFVGTTTITKVEGNVRTFTANWDLGGGTVFSGIGFDFDLVCEQVIVPDQSIGLGCGGTNTVNVETAEVPGTFTAADDSQFTVNINYNNPNCFGGFECSLTFTKQ